MKFCIITCSIENITDKWALSCRRQNVDFTFLDISQNDWLSRLLSIEADCYLLRPPGDLSYAKQMFDERAYIMANVLGRMIYPSFEEVFVYENKRLLSDYLKAKNIEQPKTYVFYKKSEALAFIKESNVPLVAKTNIGASGSGVKILKTQRELLKYCSVAFKRGIQRRRGPNRNFGTPKTWLKKSLSSPKFFMKKLQQYKARSEDVQKHFIILQEYIPHEYEWRVVKIGESYFAHKKSKIGEMASGTKNKIYDNPPLSLFDFMKEVCDKTGFYSQAVDIFESPDGSYLVNEIQTIFGQSDAYQMIVDGEIGRYIYKNGWVFESGDFNTNESYDLRLEHAIQLVMEKQ